LTNTLNTTPASTPLIRYLTISSLLRLLAPIAPALSSESWVVLHENLLNKINDQIPSILTSPWPSTLLTTEEAEALSARGGQKVAVQVNGKTRCAVTIPSMKSTSTVSGTNKNAPPSQEEQDWIISRVLETPEGKMWLSEKHDWEKRRRVIVIKGGKLVNVVF
jgi:leucyl-tRNA synthetase